MTSSVSPQGNKFSFQSEMAGLSFSLWNHARLLGQPAKARKIAEPASYKKSLFAAVRGPKSDHKVHKKEWGWEEKWVWWPRFEHTKVQEDLWWFFSFNVFSCLFLVLFSVLDLISRWKGATKSDERDSFFDFSLFKFSVLPLRLFSKQNSLVYNLLKIV